MIRVILVDDEKPLLDELEYMLKKYDDIEISAMFTDPEDALENIKCIKPDAVFLDIDMPIISGLNLAHEISHMDKVISVVFITAFNSFAVQAFEVNAVDYVMKPIKKDRLDLTIEKLHTLMEKEPLKNDSISPKISSSDSHSMLGSEKVIVFDGDVYNVIASEDILYIEVEMKDTIIATKQGSYKTKKSLDFWEAKLKDHGFFRCHRSFMVNLKHIVKVCPMFNNNYVIKLQKSSCDIPVSKSHIAELKKILNM